MTSGKGLQGALMMHRFILEQDGPIQSQLQVDHINGIKYDNRHVNLRIVTQSINARNRMKRKVMSSQYKGVSWNKLQKKWRAQINPGKVIYLGSFNKEEDAAIAYNEAALTHHGADVPINIIKEVPSER